MVTVTAFRSVETEDGDVYVRLILSGDLEMDDSENTGNFYATTRRASISCTFDEQTAQSMIGKELDGTITKVSVDPYEYTLDSGETIKIAHRWVFAPEGQQASIVDIKSKSSKAKAA